MTHWHLRLPSRRRVVSRLAAAGVVVAVYLAAFSVATANEDALPLVTGVELQPLQAQAQRVATALESVGAPLTPPQKAALDRALHETDAKQGVQRIQELLDPLCLVGVRINPESRVKVAAGPAPRQLVQHGWSVFLVKVYNDAGVTAPLACHSPNAEPLQRRSSGASEPKPPIDPAQGVQRWADVSVYDQPPLAKRLSGLQVEYRILEIYSRDAGKREAKLQFDVGQGTQDLGFRNEIDILFDCRPAVRVMLHVMDDDGRPATGPGGTWSGPASEARAKCLSNWSSTASRSPGRRSSPTARSAS